MENKTAQIPSIRVSPTENNLIRRAAEVKEQKVGDFVRKAAVKEAKKTIKPNKKGET
jgi:uncharacterized protein (DUF1778 family)